MKRLLPIFFLLYTITPVAAQITHTANGNIDKNADEILKKAANKFHSNAVSFSVNVTNKDTEKKLISKEKADILYNQGKYRVTFGDNIIYCDGTATWHWNKQADEVVVNKMSDADDDLMNPAAILKNYNKNFKAKYIRLESNGDAVIDLTPKKTKSYYKLRFIINTNNGIVKRIEMHNYDASGSEYQVSNFKSGVKTTDGDFRFPKSQNPSVEIIDMR